MVSPGCSTAAIGRGVGLRAGVRLHIDVLAAEDLARAIAGQVLHDVGILAAAVVAAPGIALGIFIGEDRAGRFKHCFGDEVFAGDHLQPLVLAEGFVVKSGGDFGVGLGEGERHAVSHTKDFTAKGAESLSGRNTRSGKLSRHFELNKRGIIGIRFGTASPGEAELLIENHG